MMSVRRVVVVGVIAATGIVAAGSNVAASTGPGTPASAELGRSAKNTKPLTKAQFIMQANGLCAAAVVASSSALQQFANIKNGSPSSQEIAAFIAAYATVVQNQIKQTQALKPPKRDRSKITKMLQETQTTLNAIKANPQLLGGKQDPFLAAETLARAYGLEGAPGSQPCTKGGSGGAGSSTPASS
jgi:hypothetical protein